MLVMANGSAKRSEKAPGHLDERAFDFDDAVDLALRSGDGRRLAALDAALGAELWASGIEPLADLGRALDGRVAGLGALRRRPLRRPVVGRRLGPRLTSGQPDL